MGKRSGKSSEKVVTFEEFKLLLNCCKHTREPIEYRFVVMAAGRLGFRVGEIAHFKKSWIDYDAKIIKIPEHEPCCCRYCKTSYKLSTKKRKVSDEEVLKHRWKPKTENSARSIYYGFDDDVVRAIETYFKKHQVWPYSYESVGNRIDRLAKKLNIDTTPHGLRATAATKFAYDGLSAPILQMLFGWKKIETANNYVGRSGNLAIKQMKEMYDANKRRERKMYYHKLVCLTPLAWKITRKKKKLSEDGLRDLFFDK